MTVESKPKCNESSVEKNIQNDIDPGVCSINLKRRDAIPETIDKIAANDSSEWKLVRETECSGSFHGGFSDCGSDLVVLEWFKILYEEREWYEAKSDCEGNDGKLISYFNGTNEHLLLIAAHVGTRFWVGATDEVNEG